MIELTRTQILKGNYLYPEKSITLDPTNHVFDRMLDRGLRIDNLPTKVKVTKDNIHSAKTLDGKHLTSVVIRIRYSMYQYLFLCMNPYDGGLKSMWFRETDRPIRY